MMMEAVFDVPKIFCDGCGEPVRDFQNLVIDNCGFKFCSDECFESWLDALADFAEMETGVREKIMAAITPETEGGK
jgi:hypothetical protein